MRLREAAHVHDRSGSQVPSVTSPRSRSCPEWSSSIDDEVVAAFGRERMTRASSSARSAVIEAPVGFWARGCSEHATGRLRSATASASGTHALLVERDAAPRRRRARRAGRGTAGSRVLSTTTRSPNRTSCSSVREIASSAPSTTVMRLGGATATSRRARSRAPGSPALAGSCRSRRGPTRARAPARARAAAAGSGVPRERSSRTGSSGAAMPAHARREPTRGCLRARSCPHARATR